MDSSELLVLCSSQPGFLRTFGGRLASRCRLLECYSLTEATQMVQLHQPRVALIDLRKAAGKSFDRTWAMGQNSAATFLVVVTNLDELDASQIPVEISQQVIHVEVDNLTADLNSAFVAVDEFLNSRSRSGKLSSAVMSLRPEADQSSGPAAVGGELRRDWSSNVGLSPPEPVSGRQVSLSLNEDGEPSASTLSERYRTRSPELRSMLERLEVAARHDVTILLIGETGSGKTHLAQLIHESSQRSSEPFLTVACGALPGELIESELFGHVKGAFTSAHADKDGKFLAAGRGTILLDEIDVLTPEQQVKLLRVIERGLFEPVGSNKTLKVEARIIAASNLELQPLVEQGRFRPDLYYRLNTLSFTIPPLRKRLPDIETLSRYFIHLHAESHAVEVSEVSEKFIDCLINYPWPGNVREMENAIRSSVIFSKGGRLTIETLPPNIVSGTAGPASDPSVAAFLGGRKGQTLGNRIELTEKDLIEQALLNNSFSRTKTARQLGVSRVTLYNKMKKYGMMPNGKD